MQLKRRFLQVGARRVHYWRAGEGPPAVLVHSSPANARLLMGEIERLAGTNTIFAFDTPGFGLSEPLPGEILSVADLADALAETLAALDMPRCPVFGTHTGAAIALEFGVRHPERASGLVLDGVPAFTDAECREYFETYFRKMPPSDLGGHYAEAWTRFRDQSVWFPWTNRTPANLNPYDPGPPTSTHLWVQMFFEAAESYEPAYRAASFYGARAIAAAAELTLPAAYCATRTDMLHPHLARLPPMRDEQEIVDIGASLERMRDLIAERFARYGADGAAPADRDSIGSGAGIARQFVDGTSGQVHLRHAGERDAPALLLLHDAPGSSEQIEPLIAQSAPHHFVIAPDLPGNGESDAYPDPPDIASYVAEAVALLDRLAVPCATVLGIGFGSSVALALATAHASRVDRLILQGLPLPTDEERAELLACYAPPIAIEADGAHWYRTWLMLRDSQVYFPWYKRQLARARRATADFTARPLHRWTMDVMRSRTSYSHLIEVALRFDAAAALSSLARSPVLVTGSTTPWAAHDERAARARPDLRTVAAGPAFEAALAGHVSDV